MKIQVLGSGCPTCKKLFELTQQAAKSLNIKEEVEYVTDVQKIIELGVMQSPVLAVDDKPIIAGFVPKLEAIQDALEQSLEDKECSCSGSGDCCCGGDCC